MEKKNSRCQADLIRHSPLIDPTIAEKSVHFLGTTSVTKDLLGNPLRTEILQRLSGGAAPGDTDSIALGSADDDTFD